MNQPQNADWQQRVLSESELNQLLLSMSSLDAIQVLQRQVDLRTEAKAHPEAATVMQPVDVPVVEVGEVPTVVPLDVAEVEPLEAPSGIVFDTAIVEPEAEVRPAVASYDPQNIATDLNAIFAARAAAAGLTEKPMPAAASEPVVVPEVTVPEVKVVAPEPVAAPFVATAPAVPAAPVALPLDFVPTFANPVPPRLQPEVPSQPVDPVQPQSTPVEPTQTAARPEPVFSEAPTLETPVAPKQQPVDDFKDSIWTLADDVQPTPEALTPGPEEVADLASAEEEFTQSEEQLFSLGDPGSVAKSTVVDEAVVEAAQPIFALDEAQEAPNEAASQSPASGRRSAISLFTTWNGNGTLLLLTATGFIAGQVGAQLSTLLAGVFTALFLSGFGFAAAALAARRGRLPQSVLARATFGVYGANLPLAFVIVARLAATALLSVFAVFVLTWFFKDLPETIQWQSGDKWSGIRTAYPILVGLLAVAGVIAYAAKGIYYGVSKVLAFVLIIWSVGAVVLGVWLKPQSFALSPNIDYASALWIATALMIVLGLIWGTSASDETPDLKSTTLVPKLVATSLLNSVVVGSVAVVAGFVVYQLNLPTIHSATTGVIFGIVLVFALANIIRRNTDAFRGFGLSRTPGWLFLLNIIVVMAAAAGLTLRLGFAGAWVNAVGYLSFVGVPVLAWLTTFGMDSVLRRTDYHEVSLMRGYGFYGKFNWASLIGWVLATAIGWGFTTSTLVEFTWLGYLGRLLNFASNESLGVWIAMGIGLLVPLIFNIPRIRNQEAEVIAIEARRTELADVLGIAD